MKSISKTIIALMGTIALCLSATAAWAADDFNLRFTKVDNDTVAYQSDITSNNGKTTHWIKVWCNGVVVKSIDTKYATAYIDSTKPVMGALAFTGYGKGCGDCGGKHLHRPIGDGVNPADILGWWTAFKLKNGIWYDEDKIVLRNGSMHYSLTPNGVLTDQEQQLDFPLPDGFIDQLGEVEVTITEDGGPHNGAWSGMKAWVPFAQSGSKIGVTHYHDTGSYVVTSFTVNLGFITAKCSKSSDGSWKLNVDWDKSDN